MLRILPIVRIDGPACRLSPCIFFQVMDIIGGFHEFIPEIGMGYGNKRKCPFPQALSLQSGNPVFGHDILTPPRVVTTPAPSERAGTILDVDASMVVEGSTIIALPPREPLAPRRKSVAPPTPLYIS